MQLNIGLFYNMGLGETRLKNFSSWLKRNGKKITSFKWRWNGWDVLDYEGCHN